MLGQVLGQGGSPARRWPLCRGSRLPDGGAGPCGRPSGACPPVRELQGPLASAGCLEVDADVVWLAEARLELGPPKVWPGGSFWPSSPLFLTSSFQKRGTVLRTQRQEVGTQLQQPSLRPPLLSGPCVLMGRWGVSGCLWPRTFLPRLPHRGMRGGHGHQHRPRLEPQCQSCRGLLYRWASNGGERAGPGHGPAQEGQKGSMTRRSHAKAVPACDPVLAP